MKREFLQNLKVGETPLSKEVIDAIMEENGNDIEAARKPFADYDTVKSQLKTARETLKGFDGQDIETVIQSAKDWEEKYNQAVDNSKKQIADMEFNHALESAITAKKGKNAKAIKALFDDETFESLKKSKNREADINSALEALEKENGYLFGENETPPPFAGGAGTDPGKGNGLFNFGFSGIRARETGK